MYCGRENRPQSLQDTQKDKKEFEHFKYFKKESEVYHKKKSQHKKMTQKQNQDSLYSGQLIPLELHLMIYLNPEVLFGGRDGF
jgi:hypothetical protein